MDFQFNADLATGYARFVERLAKDPVEFTEIKSEDIVYIETLGEMCAKMAKFIRDVKEINDEWDFEYHEKADAFEDYAESTACKVHMLATVKTYE